MRVLGYTEVSWNNFSGEELQPWSYIKSWVHLSENEKQAAVFLGYTEKSWDDYSGSEPKPPVHNTGWADLTVCGKKQESIAQSLLTTIFCFWEITHLHLSLMTRSIYAPTEHLPHSFTPLNKSIHKSHPKSKSSRLPTCLDTYQQHATPFGFSECAKCGTSKDGITCCGKGGAWRGKCGPLNDPKVKHTWREGFQSCGITTTATAQPTASKPTLTTPASSTGTATLILAPRKFTIMQITQLVCY